MQPKKTHWPSILILIVIGLGLLFFFGAAMAFAIISIMDLLSGEGDPAGLMISSFAAGLELLVLAAAAWFLVQKTMGREQAETPLKFPFAVWQPFAFPLLVIAAITIGGLVTLANMNWLSWAFLPLLTVIAILLPVLFFIGLGTNGLEMGPRWRAWGIVGLGLTANPLLMIVAEMMGIVLIIVVAGIYLAFQPELLNEATNLSNLIEQAGSDEAILQLLAPYLTNPAIIATIMGFIALFVPLVEELLKPLGVWLFARNIETPAQGFALGMLSGAAFGLLESLNASSDGTESWAFLVGIRAATTLLHMTTTGLMGYAIVSAFREKKIGRLFGMYAAVVLLHGIWNAAAMLTGFIGVGMTVGQSDWLAYAPAAICGMAILVPGMFAVLLAANRKLRTPLPPAPESAPTEESKIPA